MEVYAFAHKRNANANRFCYTFYTKPYKNMAIR